MPPPPVHGGIFAAKGQTVLQRCGFCNRILSRLKGRPLCIDQCARCSEVLAGPPAGDNWQIGSNMTKRPNQNPKRIKIMVKPCFRECQLISLVLYHLKHRNTAGVLLRAGRNTGSVFAFNIRFILSAGRYLTFCLVCCDRHFAACGPTAARESINCFEGLIHSRISQLQQQIVPNISFNGIE
jgi:hypothetical protein